MKYSRLCKRAQHKFLIICKTALSSIAFLITPTKFSHTRLTRSLEAWYINRLFIFKYSTGTILKRRQSLKLSKHHHNFLAKRVYLSNISPIFWKESITTTIAVLVSLNNWSRANSMLIGKHCERRKREEREGGRGGMSERKQESRRLREWWRNSHCWEEERKRDKERDRYCRSISRLRSIGW